MVQPIEEIWHAFHQPLRQFVIRRTGNPAIADDIVQDVFLRIQTHLHSLKSGHKLKAWLYQVTRNAIVDHYRREKRLEELPADLPEHMEDNNQNLNREVIACLMPFLNQLPEKYREALRLTEIEGHSQKALSDLLNISFSGAKSRVQRGRQKLKAMLEACCAVQSDRYGNIVEMGPSDRCC